MNCGAQFTEIVIIMNLGRWALIVCHQVQYIITNLDLPDKAK